MVRSSGRLGHLLSTTRRRRSAKVYTGVSEARTSRSLSTPVVGDKPGITTRGLPAPIAANGTPATSPRSILSAIEAILRGNYTVADYVSPAKLRS